MQSQGHRALFYEETEGGHGGGGDLSRQANFYASEYLFLQRELEGAEPKPLAAAAGLAIAPRSKKPAVPRRSAASSTRWTSRTAIDVTPSQRSRQVGPFALMRRYCQVRVRRALIRALSLVQPLEKLAISHCQYCGSSGQSTRNRNRYWRSS